MSNRQGHDNDSEPIAGGGGITRGTNKSMMGGFSRVGITDPDEQRTYMTVKLDGLVVESRKDLTEEQGQKIVAALRADWRKAHQPAGAGS